MEKTIREIVTSTVDIIGNTEKNAVLYHGVLKELKAGKSLDDIVMSKLPGMNAAEVSAELDSLLEGVQDMYNREDATVNEADAKQKVLNMLSQMGPNKQMNYLCNLAVVFAAAYSELTLTGEAKEAVEQFANGQPATQEMVNAVSKNIMDMIDHHAGVLTRSSVRAMDKLLTTISKEAAQDAVIQGETEAVAYAATIYIRQKLSNTLVVDGMPVKSMSAYSIGVHSAAEMENSRLMLAYRAGRITRLHLQESLQILWTKVTAFLMNDIVHYLPNIAAGLVQYGIFKMTRDYVLVFLYLNTSLALVPLKLLALAAGLCVSTELISNHQVAELISETVEGIVHVLTTIYHGIASILHRLFGSEHANTTVATESQIVDASENVDTVEENANLKETLEVEEPCEAEITAYEEEEEIVIHKQHNKAFA